MGNINTASWFAIGVKQNLNEQKTISSITFLGFGETSNPDDYNPVDRAAIYVINQEFTNRFATHWEYAGALSYRWQNSYKTKAPFEIDASNNQQEIRTYAKLSYLNNLGSIDYSVTLRPEFRLFYNPDFNSPEKKAQFRTRLKGKMAFNLNVVKTRKIIASAEMLLAVSETENWDTYQFNESRFCLYYSVKIPKQKMTLNLGYMNDLVLKSSVHDANYIAVDIKFTDLFSS